MSTSHVNHWTATATTIAVSPATVGNVMLAGFRDSTFGAATLSGGGVSAWTLIETIDAAVQIRLFYGVVTAIGAATISSSGPSLDWGVGEFAAVINRPTWSVFAHGSQSNGSGQMLYPQLTSPTPGADSLYFGYLRPSAVASCTAGADSGTSGDAATYLVSAASNGYCYIASCSNATLEVPIQTYINGPDSSGVAAAIVSASSPTVKNPIGYRRFPKLGLRR